jgi:excisionase family DNA binding protein
VATIMRRLWLALLILAGVAAAQNVALSILARDRDRPAVARLREALSTGPLRLVDPGGETIPLPEPAYRVLVRAIDMLNAGRAVVLRPYNTMLTTQEAAELLHVSRQYLITLLEDRRIPYEVAGTDRRIRITDLLRFKAERGRKRKAILRTMTRENADLYAD